MFIKRFVENSQCSHQTEFNVSLKINTMKKPFKETDIGKFLQSKGFDTALKVIGDAVPGVGILSSVKDLVLGTTTHPAEIKLSPEDKAQFLELYKFQIDELDLQLKDVANARSREVELNVSEQSSWLAKNITSILALMLVMAFISLCFTYVLSVTPDPMVAGVLHDFKDLMLLLCGYYWGSSSNSKIKDNIINKLTPR